METKSEIKKLGLIGSFAIYTPASIVMFCFAKYLIPYLSKVTGQEIILFWFIVAGLGIFLPMVIIGLLILKSEGFVISKNTLVERLRFRKITKQDILWSFVGFIFRWIIQWINNERFRNVDRYIRPFAIFYVV